MGAAPEGGPRGYVLAAPHDGYDMHTGDMLARIRERLAWGWVVATGYRSYRRQEWVDVNRPTGRAWSRGRFGSTREGRTARRVYEEYQAALCKAGGVEPEQPLQLLVELHGHDRKVEREGKQCSVEVIELATRGFGERDLRRINSRWQRLVRRHVPEELRVPLAVEQLHEAYPFRGEPVRFKFGASGAKELGALRPERAERALHFEMPACLRKNEASRAAYAIVFAELLADLD